MRPFSFWAFSLPVAKENMRHNQRLFNNGFDGYELAPSFGAVDPVSAIAGGIGALANVTGMIANIADGPRQAQAALDLAKAQGASAERIAQLQLQAARANALAAQQGSQQGASTEKDNTLLYVGIGGAALVALLGLGFIATRKK